MKKISFVLPLLVLSIVLVSSNVKVVSAADIDNLAKGNQFCTFFPPNEPGQPYGDVTINQNCVVYESINGASSGTLTIDGATVSLHRGMSFDPGQQINLVNGGQIWVNTGGYIQKGRLCVKDADNDHYADTITVTKDPNTGLNLSTSILQIDYVLSDPKTNLCPVGYNLRESMNDLTMADSDTSTQDVAKVSTSDRELLRLGFTLAGVTDTLAAAGDVQVINKNMLVCTNSSCPTTNFATNSGSLYVAGKVGIGYTNPNNSLTVNGYIGTGTTSPSANIHAYSTSATSIRVESAIASNAALELYQGGNYRWGIVTPGSTTDLRFFDGTADRLTLKNGGNIGIGTTDPGYKLQVAGTIYASGSSRDYKEKIKPLEIDSSKIYSLKPVSYDYKKDYQNLGYNLAGGRQFGLIAEDVYPVIPELVISLGNKKTANIDYPKLSILLLDQMQKQKKEIDSLKSQIDNLEKEINQIKQTIKNSR